MLRPQPSGHVYDKNSLWWLLFQWLHRSDSVLTSGQRSPRHTFEDGCRDATTRVWFPCAQLTMSVMGHVVASAASIHIGCNIDKSKEHWLSSNNSTVFAQIMELVICLVLVPMAKINRVGHRNYSTRSCVIRTLYMAFRIDNKRVDRLRVCSLFQLAWKEIIYRDISQTIIQLK